MKQHCRLSIGISLV